MGLLENVVIPEVWNDSLPYTIPEKSKFFASPAVIKDSSPGFSSAGIFTHQPIMKEPVADLEEPSFTADLTVNRLYQEKDIMVCVTRQVDYMVTKQEIRRSGANLGQILYNNVAEYMAKQYEKFAMRILKAIYAPGGALYATHTIDGNATIDFHTIFTGKKKLGDASGELTMSAYHSEIVNQLREAGMTSDMINYKENQIVDGTITKVAGMPIIESDLMPVVNVGGTNKYLSFLMGNNSIYFANPYIEVETWNYPKRAAGEEHIIISTDFCIHVPGVKYALGNPLPTNEQLAAPTSWVKVADHNKDIKLVALLTPVA